MSTFIRHLLAAQILLLLTSPAPAAPAAPDFTGIWVQDSPDAKGQPVDIFAALPPLPGGAPQLKEPYASAYKALLERRKDAERRGTTLIDATTQCLPEGMPTIMAATYSLEILQTPKQLVVLAEFLTQTRRIYIGETMPPPDEIAPSYNGYSVAHWEENTLVVETRGVRDDVRFEPWGIPHSASMKITERLRLTGPDTLENQVTLEDADALAKPYIFTFRYKKDPSYKIMEYICSNNKYKADSNGEVTIDTSPNGAK